MLSSQKFFWLDKGMFALRKKYFLKWETKNDKKN